MPGDDSATEVTREEDLQFQASDQGYVRFGFATTVANALLWRNAMAASARHTGAGRPWPQVLGLAFGAIYLVVGIVGFFVTGFDNFAGHDDHTLLVFDINPLHNVVHVLIGVAGLALSRTLTGARTFGLLLAVGYGLAFVYGLFAVGQDWDVLNLNWADNVLHVASALVGAAIVAGSRRFVGDSTRV